MSMFSLLGRGEQAVLLSFFAMSGCVGGGRVVGASCSATSDCSSGLFCNDTKVCDRLAVGSGSNSLAVTAIAGAGSSGLVGSDNRILISGSGLDGVSLVELVSSSGTTITSLPIATQSATQIAATLPNTLALPLNAMIRVTAGVSTAARDVSILKGEPGVAGAAGPSGPPGADGAANLPTLDARYVMRSAPKTYPVTAADFVNVELDQGGPDWQAHSNGNYLENLNPEGGADMCAPLHLPEHSTITGVKCYIRHNSVAASAILRIFVRTHSLTSSSTCGGLEIDQAYNSGACGGDCSVSSGAPLCTVDTDYDPSDGTFQSAFLCAGRSGAIPNQGDFRIYGCGVTYTTP